MTTFLATCKYEIVVLCCILPKIAPMRPMITATSSSDLVQATLVTAAIRETMQPANGQQQPSITRNIALDALLGEIEVEGLS